MPLPRFRITERQVLLLMLAGSLVTVGAAFLWRELFRERADRLAPGGAARVHWMRPSEPGERSDVRQILAEYLDPSLMALPSPHGFSARAWQRLAPARVPTFLPKREPVYLAAPTDLPVPVLLEERELPVLVEAGVERVAASLATPNGSLELSGAVPVTNSVVEVLGDLTRRRVVRQPALPVAPGEAAVRRTRVLVAVGVDGRVRQAVVDRPSGNEVLDGQALEAAQLFEFESILSADRLAVMWGTLRFVWASGNGRP
jgi:TonB family protein